VTPGLLRRLASLFYETLVLSAIAFFAAAVFFFASGGQSVTGGALLALQTLFIFSVCSLYLIASWLRGGQTLAMRAWRIRLAGVTPLRALLRLGLAALLVPSGIGLLWAFLDRERQFLHDRLAGTRLVLQR
jgi:uncharacterized RDD family membrane protein YckC